MKIYFDMDGTIGNLYAVEGWLDMLRAFDSTPYEVAEPIGDLATICDLLNTLQAKGIEIGVISWLSKESTADYDKKVRNAKYKWLRHNMNISFDEIHIIKYGKPKTRFCSCTEDILFDDEEHNRNEWGGRAYTPQEIVAVLEGLM